MATIPHLTIPALGLAVMAGTACAPAPGPNSPVSTATPVSVRVDTFSGTIAVVGARPLTRVVLQTDDGEQLTLTDAAAGGLNRLDGVDIHCRGHVREATLRVERFEVVGARGVRAVDGRLELRDGTAVLVRPNGRRVSFAPAPGTLRDWAGGRVWIAGEPGGEPEAWGLIEPPEGM